MVTALRMIETRLKIIQKRHDDLYKKGQADKWPEPIMNYLMWVEHEISRELEGIRTNVIEASRSV